MIYESIGNMIDKFGRVVKVISPEKTTQIGKAFIQPFRHKDFSFTGGKCTDIGALDGSSFLYIGKNNIRLDLYPFNTVVETSEESYVVKRAQKVCLGDDIIYIWAIVQLYKEEDEN